MTRQFIMVMLTMIVTLSSAIAFTQYMDGQREQLLNKQKLVQADIDRAASLMPRPAPLSLKIGNILYHLTPAPRGQLTYHWLGITENIGLYAVYGEGIQENGMLAIKHDDGTYSFYIPSQTASVSP